MRKLIIYLYYYTFFYVLIFYLIVLMISLFLIYDEMFLLTVLINSNQHQRESFSCARSLIIVIFSKFGFNSYIKSFIYIRYFTYVRSEKAQVCAVHEIIKCNLAHSKIFHNSSKIL